MTAVIKLKQLIYFFAAILAVAVLSVLNYTSGSYAVFFGGTARKLPIYSVGREDKYISITFDCAWGTDYTDSILNALRVSGVAATFFMVQFWAEKYPDYVLKIDEAGCEIGTHSATHSYMSKLSESEIRAELTSSCEVITAITGKAVEVFRPPYGDYDDLLVQTAQDMGLYSIQWDVDSLDWKGLSATDIAMRVINKVQSGSIILMHNNGEHTAEAVPVILQTLINSGYKFVTVGELIYRDNYTIDAAGRQYSNA
ncbi:MAG: polysaccharide deacetylase family protein [Clostridia bacterium]|nr:polysaccharide deacetylase family protein [Clostridia bacterium]